MAGAVLKWKTTPPCSAHTKLVQLFKDKKVSSSDKAAKFYYCDEEFQKYSMGTFRGYFNKQKRDHRLACKTLFFSID